MYHASFSSFRVTIGNSKIAVSGRLSKVEGCVQKTFYNLVFDSYLLKHFTIYNNSRLTDLIISNNLKHSSYVEFLDLFPCINIHGDFTKFVDLLKLRPLKVLNVAYTQFTNENVCTVQNVASILSELWINECSFMF